MDTLPTELQDLILAHCSHATQKTLRSVSQHFHDLATPPVFGTVHLAPCTFTLHLQHLRSLASSPKSLAKHVKRIHFYADILPPWDRHDFEAAARKSLAPSPSNRAEDSDDNDDDDEDKLHAAWRTFSAHRSNQTEWFYDNESYLYLFKEALSSLPNLCSASVGISLPFQPHRPCSKQPIWSRLKAKMLISPDDWLYDNNEDAGYRYNDLRMVQTARATLNLLEAIGFRSTFAGITQVTSLRVQCLSNGRWKSLMAGRVEDFAARSFSPHVEARFQTMLAAFAYLTDLDLSIPHPVTETARRLSAAERDELLDLSAREVTTILTHAINLRRLRFEYDSESGTFWEPGEETLHPLYPLFSASASPWPRLESLDLSINVPHGLLLSFLAQLSPSLRRLELRDMCVYDAQALFKGLPNAVRLESVYLECLWTKIHVRYASIHAPPTTCILNEGSDADLPYARGVKAYLLGQAEDCPRLTEEEFLMDDEERQIVDAA